MTPRDFGYIRVRNARKATNADTQIAELLSLGVQAEDIFIDDDDLPIATGPEFKRALSAMQRGDSLTAIALRAGGSLQSHDLMPLYIALSGKGAFLVVPALHVDTRTDAGLAQLQILVDAIAEAKADWLAARTAKIREGVAAARAARGFHGPIPTAQQKSEQVVQLSREGKSPTEIGRTLGISRSSVYRILNDADLKNTPPP